MPDDASSAASQTDFVYAFAAPQGEARSIVVHSDYAVEPYLRFFLAGWPARRLNAVAPADIFLRHVTKPAMAFLAERRDDRLEVLNELDGVNRLADLLSHVAASQSQGLAELHASAVLVGDRLALFVGPSLSGKSSLSLQLAARGCRLFADDRLLVGPLDPRGDATAPARGMALGLTPRVRRPPHPAAGALFARFAERHMMEGSGPIGFLALPAVVAASFAETAQIGALILPQRRETGGVALLPAGAAAAGRVVLEQMHAPQVEAANFLAAVRRLTEAVPAWHLQYDNSAAAALEVRDMMAG